ncbi:MAG: EAL domain-containing protein [Nocardioidaceae bacterium]
MTSGSPDAGISLAAWARAIREVLDDEVAMTVLAQPIVSLHDGSVAGYEMLSRFDGEPDAPPDQWFAAAQQLGYGAALNAMAIELSLDMLDELPANTFISVNVDPDALIEPVVLNAFLSRGPLDRVVIELTEHVPLDETAAMIEIFGKLRAAGALLAVDDTGSGYSGLRALLALRPDVVKIDRDLVVGCHTDPAKYAVVQMLGELSDRLNAWVVAEGVETEGELRALTAMGVPLAQGWYAGRPAPGWTDASQDVRRAVKSVIKHSATDTIERLMVPADRLKLGEFDRPGVVCDSTGRPMALVVHDPWGELVSLPVMTTTITASPRMVARRAMTRPQEQRYAPVVCITEQGETVGVVGIDALLVYLSSIAEPDRGEELGTLIALPRANAASNAASIFEDVPVV